MEWVEEPEGESGRVGEGEWEPGERIVEAQGWVIDEEGNVTLVVEVPRPTLADPAFVPAHCR
ncbi:MAG: hypothetical protein HC925_02990 [Coleofasciculaceae cyanobacterium SM2_3_26]|nr:hypothetical protein [Coleofasciculaceae cyanobacterium SM2_3_26]